MREDWVGFVTDYYPKTHAAAVHIEGGDLRVGDVVHIVGRSVDIEERVTSLEIDDEPTDVARPGDEVGIRVHEPVRKDADVFVVRDRYDEAEADALKTVLRRA